MRGQGYDCGANMSAKYKGVQKRILDLNPLAAYIPCSNHSLNLNLNDTASASPEINAFFHLFKKFLHFFLLQLVVGMY